MDIKRRIKKIISWKLLIGVVVGGVLGFAYYHFIGCNTGSCSITSNPTNSVLYGMLFGGVLTT